MTGPVIQGPLGESIAARPDLEDDLNGSGTRAAPAGSILSKLRRQAQRQAQDHIEDFKVGGDFGDWLWIRYKPLGPDRLDSYIANMTEVSASKAVQVSMDMLAQCCIGVVGKDASTGEELVLEANGRPLVLEHALLELLEMPIPPGARLTSTEVITTLFGNNGAAIADHSARVATWMQNPESKDEDEESDGKVGP
jgi:hypothetical protein